MTTFITDNSTPNVPGQTSPSTNTPPEQRPLAPLPPPAQPKVQAVGFALELAKIRAAAGTPGNRTTDVGLLLSDADAIAKFIGPNDVQTAINLRA